ncbi:MAG: DNA polymerase III subunit beta [Bacteroides sp.]|nr:DNA polymerase III subunit beta [Roseburia sp.]MCM1347472.1 DNA polymerase III subunit beta [Bacteroides sp.]MCM1421325.1 DNA polymerase III subunit beta [Bacteroides sp.]
MKFNVSSTTLCGRLQMISRVLSSKNSIAILDCILFELEDNVLKLTASDGDTTLVTSVETNDADMNGRFAINAKTLIDALKEISEQPITFEVNTSSNEIEIVYQNGKYNLIGQNGTEYPTPMAMGDTSRSLTIAVDTLLNGITRTLFATAEDELRPVMNGVYFDITTENMTFVASDGHKLVRNRNYAVHGEENAAFILPKKPALMLKNILPKENGDAQIMFDDRNAEINMSGYKLSCRLIEGRYPNYNSVIPADNPFKVTVDRQALISALRRVSVFASVSNALIKLRLESNTLTVSAQDIDFSTSAEERIICEYEGTPMSIGFKGTFLLDILNGITGQEVILELADPSRAGVIVPAEQEEGEDLLMLLMPMMLND